MSEEILSGGNLTAVVRIGDSVRRPTGFWSPNVHALLRHLAANGFELSPRVLGVDERGRECLTYIVGAAGTYPDGWPFAEDENLVEVGAVLRRYHDATQGFVAPPDGWRYQIDAPRTGPVICHNDFAPYNCIFRDGKLVGVVDWDFAAPGPREWDLAHALWRFTPLYPPAEWWLGTEEPFTTERLVRRMRLLCRGYGAAFGPDLLDVIEARQQSVFRTIKRWAREGVPGFARMLAEVDNEDDFAELSYLRERKAEIVRAATSAP